MRKRTKKSHRNDSLSWLPIDSRLVAPLFSFSHVRGIARFFLELEMAIALLIVLGALVLFGLRIFELMPS